MFDTLVYCTYLDGIFTLRRVQRSRWEDPCWELAKGRRAPVRLTEERLADDVTLLTLPSGEEVGAVWEARGKVVVPAGRRSWERLSGQVRVGVAEVGCRFAHAGVIFVDGYPAHQLSPVPFGMTSVAWSRAYAWLTSAPEAAPIRTLAGA